MPQKSMTRQRLPLMVVAATLVAPTALLLCLTYWLASLKGMPLATFVRDPAAVTGSPFYTGALSNVGNLMWCATAALCLFTGVVTRSSARPSDAATVRFFLIAGFLSALLLFDDLFLMHEVIVPKYLGLPDDLLYAVYIALIAALVGGCWTAFSQTAYLVFLLSLGFLGASFGLDWITDSRRLAPLFESRDFRFFVEDSFKLLGIATWLGYFGWSCHDELTRPAASAAMQRAVPDV